MSKPIEFKAGTLPAMSAVIRELDNVRLSDSMHTMLGGLGEFFAGEATVIDLTQLVKVPDRADWVGLLSLLRRYGLQPIAVRQTPEHLIDSARKAGLAVLSSDTGRLTGERAVTAPTAAPVPAPAATAVAAKSEPAQASLDMTPPMTNASTMIIERPLRSGQQIYAKGGDVVILGGVSNGAEVIADGSIHCYGPLRGRALAGAQGDLKARILTTSFAPELVSIAGVYRTFERGIAANLAGKPAHAVLRASTAGQQTLNIETLQLD
ncbi:MAG TPA: septum site-determining protein MinC [Rhodocyclaceae bacterium]|nr:septum site-determining protein MinC [Rhodocyclaceae bacterium]